MENFKRLRKVVLSTIITASLLSLASCETNNGDLDSSIMTTTEETQQQNYIVVFKDNVLENIPSLKNYLATQYGITEQQISNEYSSIFKGFTLKTSKSNIEAIELDSKIELVVKDAIINESETPEEPYYFDSTERKIATRNVNGSSMDEHGNIILPSGEVQPWAVSVVGSGNGTGKTVWVMDEGLHDNGDLNIDRKRSKSFSEYHGWEYEYEVHGNDVAALVAAKKNGKGIHGIAYGASVVIVKPGGNASSILKAFEYVKKNIKPGEIFNFSQGLPRKDLITSSQLPQLELIEKAFKSLAENNICTIAGGNSYQNLDEHYYFESSWSTSNDNAKVIGGISRYNSRGGIYYDYWGGGNNGSAYGSKIDYWAPASKLPTIRRGKLKYSQGTSLSAPIVAGVLLLNQNPKNALNITYNNHTATVPAIK